MCGGPRPSPSPSPHPPPHPTPAPPEGTCHAGQNGQCGGDCPIGECTVNSDEPIYQQQCLCRYPWPPSPTPPGCPGSPGGKLEECDSKCRMTALNNTQERACMDICDARCPYNSQLTPSLTV